MLGELGSWNDDLSRRNVVVWKENDLKKVSNRMIIVDLVTDSCDQLDDRLSVVITRGSLTTNGHDS